jgi:hypothetical protein
MSNDPQNPDAAKPADEAGNPDGEIRDQDLTKVVGGTQDIHITKPIDKPSPILYP